MLFLVVRVEGINIWGHIFNKASVQASTITGLIQLACLASDDSVHLWTHLQLLVSVLLAAVPLNMRGDRGCLFTHDVQTTVGIRKAITQCGCYDGNASCFAVQTPCYNIVLLHN